VAPQEIDLSLLSRQKCQDKSFLFLKEICGNVYFEKAMAKVSFAYHIPLIKYKTSLFNIERKINYEKV